MLRRLKLPHMKRELGRVNEGVAEPGKINPRVEFGLKGRCSEEFPTIFYPFIYTIEELKMSMQHPRTAKPQARLVSTKIASGTWTATGDNRYLLRVSQFLGIIF
jgi:hypothetical protein